MAAEDTAVGTVSAGADADAQSGRTAWARNLAAPVRDFLATETGSAAVLVVAAVVALVWANSPMRHSYESLWTTELSVRLGGGEVANDLRGWVNDGLMTLFFLVVGLEAKRELDVGDLRDRSRVLLPMMAAFGGHPLPDRDLRDLQRRRLGSGRLGSRDVHRHRARARRARADHAGAPPRGCASSS